MSNQSQEAPISDLQVFNDPSLLEGKCVQVYDPVGEDTFSFDASALVATAKDLSMYTIDGTSLILRETATSYVVRTPGLYKFPVVYGNGIRKGVPNVEAYTNLGGSHQKPFYNHLGNQISSPYIEKNANCQPASAVLRWQTAQSLADNVSLIEGGDCKYIQFRVKSIPATNGILALDVRDSGGHIMWTWYIWLTSDDLGPLDFVNHTGVTQKLMSEGLFAIWNSDRTSYRLPHFQWGRPHMGKPLNGSGSELTLYDASNNTYSGFGVRGSGGDGLSTKTVAEAIQNPDTFFTYYDTTYYNWNDNGENSNYWNALIDASSSIGDNQDTAVKTVYDPSPTGFMVPNGNAFTGFTTTGGNTTDQTAFNVVGSFSAGWKFKKNAGDIVGNLFPAAGYRDSGSGGLGGVGSGGYYWSYASASQTHAYLLYFYSGGVYPLLNGLRSYGFAVRPSRELRN
jgi:hypothetical protein